MSKMKMIKRLLCVCFATSMAGTMMVDAAAANETVKSAAQTPRIAPAKFAAQDVIIADIVVDQGNYGADATGAADSTAAIQRAIDDCYAAGGGTVFLPDGTYKVTGNITVRAFVTLRGDWQDPDTGTKYGTIIKADVASTDEDLPALFSIMGSAGVMGLTVYYPEQDINDVKPYPYTFYIPGGHEGFMLQSVTNCTVINGYKGIAACINGGGHEMMTIDNVKGTFLYRGATAYNQSDVGTWKNLTISNKYWAGAGAAFNSPERSELDAYTRKNAIGLVLGDLEWTQFANIEIADCKYGIHIVKGMRIEFAGSLFNVRIERCDVGIQVDSIDARWGMIVAKSQIYGSENAIMNNTFGVVKLAGTELSGGQAGGKFVVKNIGQLFDFIKSLFRYGINANRKYLIECDNLDGYTVDYSAAPYKPAENLFTVQADKTGAVNASPAIQAALDLAAGAGGVVYIPAGKYRMNEPVTVPAGVELRGSSSVPTRDQPGSSRGTVILAYYGLNPGNPDTDTALITLGTNAGVRGIRIFFPENTCVRPGALGTVQTGSYAIRGSGSGVYVINSAIAAAYNGIDFRGCDNHHIKKFVSCCYNNAIVAGGSNGIIEGCLQNGTVLARNGLNLPNWVDEGSQMFPYLFNAVTRIQTEYIKLDGAESQTIYNCFSYGVKTFMNNTNSVDLLAFNIGADNIGGTMLITQGGSAAIINMMRYNGSSYTNNGTELKLYNRLTIGDKTEKTVK